MLKNQILVFSLIGRETMLMKRCILIGFHISTSFPVKKLVWLEENRMAETERDFSEDEFSAALVEALRNFYYDSLKVEQIECLQWVLICLREHILAVLPTGFGKDVGVFEKVIESDDTNKLIVTVLQIANCLQS